VKSLVFRAVRTVAAFGRPSRRRNLKRLYSRGEQAETFAIEEATSAHIPVIARVHVKSWNDTYGRLGARGPRVEFREQQWREAFARADGNWFCLALTTAHGELVGFAKATRTDSSAELNKIFLLREYQRLGFGRRLLGHITERLRAQGVTSMCVYSDPRNPSCAFFEKLGAERLRDDDGRLHYNWYIWRDLAQLAAKCATSGQVKLRVGQRWAGPSSL
jgi:GNAT superfamily N-acetyltransferase